MQSDKPGQADFSLTVSESGLLRDALEHYWSVIGARTPYDPISLQELAGNPEAQLVIALYSRLTEHVAKLSA